MKYSERHRKEKMAKESSKEEGIKHTAERTKKREKKRAEIKVYSIRKTRGKLIG